MEKVGFKHVNRIALGKELLDAKEVDGKHRWSSLSNANVD